MPTTWLNFAMLFCATRHVIGQIYAMWSWMLKTFITIFEILRMFIFIYCMSSLSLHISLLTLRWISQCNKLCGLQMVCSLIYQSIDSIRLYVNWLGQQPNRCSSFQVQPSSASTSQLQKTTASIRLLPKPVQYSLLQQDHALILVASSIISVHVLERYSKPVYLLVNCSKLATY